MLGIDSRVARAAWTVVAVVLLLCLVYLLRRTLFVFILALLFAYLISPLVNQIDRFLPRRRSRTAALALAYIIFVGLVVLAGVQIGTRVVEQAQALTTKLPDMIRGAIDSWQKPTTGSPALDSLKQEIASGIRNEAGNLISRLVQASISVLSLASEVIYVVIIPILAFFFLKDAGAIRQHILDLVAEGAHRALLDEVLADIHLLLAHYMRALVLLSASAFTAYVVFFSILGVPYAFLLAALGGLLEFVPMLGPLAAGVTILVVAGVAGGHTLAVVIFLVAYRMVQDYGLSPYLMGQGVELHPLLVLFGVFSGAEIAGIAGAFLSVPVLALARILYLRFRKARMSVLYTSPTNLGS